MARKTFVLDTSVLIYDPESLLRFTDNDVIIPLTVLEELGSKKRLNNELGKNARHALRFIDTLKGTYPGNLNEGIKTDNGIMIRMQLEPKFDMAPLPITNDNKIILNAYYLKKQGLPVVFVSKDFVSRLKAESLEIEAEDYESLKFSFENMYHGMRKFDVAKEVIDNFYKDSRLDPEPYALLPNEFCLLKSPENSSAIGRFDQKEGIIQPLMKMSYDIWGVKPLNVEQRCAFDLLLRDDIKLVTLVGPAGTGKTLVALACALRKVFDENVYSKILVSRPIIPLGQDIGYLPGTKEEKLIHWMQPVYDNLEYLCGTSEDSPNETLRWVIESKKIEMEAVTYIRGRTLPRIFMIIDEAQNLTPHEVKTIISRAGEGAKVVLTGDPTQIDNPYLDKDSNGLTFTIGKFRGQKIFGHMFLEKTERSDLAALAANIM